MSEHIKQKVLILGNKPYNNFNLNGIIDSFDIIYRFNLASVGKEKNSGTKFGKLGMCQHVYKNFVKDGLSREKIIEKYKHEVEIPFLNEWYDFFHKNKENFEEIYHQDEYNSAQWNRMLGDYGCPYRFSRMASTGYSAIFTNLLEGDKEIYVLGFTLRNDELRETIGDNDVIVVKKNQNQSCHSFQDERRILSWLHNNGKIDISLCMLEDTKELNLVANSYNTEPSEFILNLLKNREE